VSPGREPGATPIMPAGLGLCRAWFRRLQRLPTRASLPLRSRRNWHFPSILLGVGRAHPTRSVGRHLGLGQSREGQGSERQTKVAQGDVEVARDQQ